MLRCKLVTQAFHWDMLSGRGNDCGRESRWARKTTTTYAKPFKVVDACDTPKTMMRLLVLDEAEDWASGARVQSLYQP